MKTIRFSQQGIDELLMDISKLFEERPEDPDWYERGMYVDGGVVYLGKIAIGSVSEVPDEFSRNSKN